MLWQQRASVIVDLIFGPQTETSFVRRFEKASCPLFPYQGAEVRYPKLLFGKATQSWEAQASVNGFGRPGTSGTHIIRGEEQHTV